MRRILFLLLLPLICGMVSCTRGGGEPTEAPRALIVGAYVNGNLFTASWALGGIPAGTCEIVVEFSHEVSVDPASLARVLFTGGELTARVGEDPTCLVFTPVNPLASFRTYQLTIPSGEIFGVELLKSFSCSFTTIAGDSDQFPRISTDELLTKVQQQTFKYFWDYAHPVSGLARERLGSDNTVTTGGSGFGIMTIPVAVERGFITRAEGAERLRKIVTFLSEKADHFHGAFSHWLDGETGKAIPFSAKDDGGDLVETAFLIEGLLTAAQYFDAASEADIRSGIDAIWRAVEWDWYTRGGQDVLYWHWSPDQGWAMNMKISGWNEALIIYVLAASSPTHPIPKTVYDKGWARSGGIRNGKKFYDITLPLGSDYGGPLFFTHYSFLGLDPHGLKDAWCTSYWDQNVAHARINHAYCVANPGKHAGYGDACWGLTASDIPKGYTASSPTNDKGVIAPTAALASFPYTPAESLKALEYFYYKLGDKLWGDYGFYDAFCLDQAWFAPSYIAIDQGPIVVMIENYRTGLLWRLFMQNTDVAAGLTKLGFQID